jgi:stage V sporulation protein G
MSITEVKVRPVESEGKIKAMASITFDECFVVTGLKVMSGSNGLFVAMPSRKTAEGEYKDICFPVSKETRAYIQEQVLTKYNNISEPAPQMYLIDDDDELPF